MRTVSRRVKLLMIGVAAVAAFAGAPVEAAGVDVIARVNATQFMPDLSFQATSEDGFPVKADASSATGWGLGFEILATRRLGVAFQVANASPTVRVELDATPDYEVLTARDDLRVTTYQASLNLHLTPDRRIDVYVSPTVALLTFGGLGFEFENPVSGESDLEEFDVKREVSWGVGMGVDIPFGNSGWLATASATYLDSTIEVRPIDGSTAESLSFDPFLISAGVGYRF